MVPDRVLPPALVERALAFEVSGARPAPPRYASTVVLLRDGAAGPEVYLLRRHAAMAFASGMHVFPGGSVDPRDVDHEVPWAGPSPGVWATALGVDAPLARGFVCAAVRETFEESGVLLAGASPSGVVADTTGDDCERDRQALVDRALSLGELLERRGLVLRSDLLRPWAQWVTPEFEPLRFDTMFFLAALPVGQRARDVSGEADHVAWVRPGDALLRHQRGELAMLPPTVLTLREVSAHSSVAEVLAAAEGRSITPVLPRAVVDEGADGPVVRLLLPGEPGYP